MRVHGHKATVALQGLPVVTVKPAAFKRCLANPFGEAARHQDEGGTDLGLAIARDIARSHGGDITLGDSPMGGLRAPGATLGTSAATTKAAASEEKPPSAVRSIPATPLSASRCAPPPRLI
jgi:hypothetical protein